MEICFNDQELGWEPEDIFDFEEWLSITIGEDGAGNDYQVHVCTPVSISRIEKKDSIFMVDKWDGLKSIENKINEFIASELADNVKDNPYYVLSKHWRWEYSS